MKKTLTGTKIRELNPNKAKSEARRVLVSTEGDKLNEQTIKQWGSVMFLISYNQCGDTIEFAPPWEVGGQTCSLCASRWQGYACVLTVGITNFCYCSPTEKTPPATILFKILKEQL